MERRFTLRLNQEDSLSVEEIKELTGEVTDSGAIRYAVNDYIKLRRELDKVKKELQGTNTKLQVLEEDVSGFLGYFNKLNNRKEKNDKRK